MYSRVKTCVLQGLEGHIVDVETDLSRGMPKFNIVGLADISIKESKERVRSAIKNIGYEFPVKRITINLIPANLKKDGSQLDLAIAVGILSAVGVINEKEFDDIGFIGELSLDGSINSVDGVLPMVISMRNTSIKKCIVPYDCKEEAAAVKDLDIIPAKDLYEVVEHLNKTREIGLYFNEAESLENSSEFDIDFSDIKGQEALKRALEVSAAGSHNLLIIGPPGAGKTMAAKRFPTILPDLTFEEAIEVTKIYSISGLLKEKGLVRNRPFRAPHHTASQTSIIGGGRIPKPGEVSLAHNGVLFLDELPEFQKQTIEVLRQPMEDGIVNISRVNASLSYPSAFILLASMNPCPCGFYGDPLNECSCTQNSIDRYLGKISNPLLDRIDIHIEVQPVKYEELRSKEAVESSESIRDRVNKARDIQLKRYYGSLIYSNAQLKSKDIKKYCKLKDSAENIMNMAFKKYKFSARSYDKVLKLSRTIADLDGVDQIDDEHILEAIRYRTLDNKYWG